VVHEPLGAGGMGVVYRATDRLSGQAVALKYVMVPPAQLLFASRSMDTDAVLALAREFRTLASLHHPNIIRVLDYGFDAQRQPFYTMDLLEGAQTVVDAGQGQDLDAQVDLLVQTLQALVYLHRRGVLHRDLKPGNVLVVDDAVRVLDFGLSVVTEQGLSYATRTTAGTMAYIAPELFAGGTVTSAADLYAVGVMAYEMLAGRLPYNDANMALLLNDILNRSVDVHALGLTPELAAVLERLLVKDPRARYADAGQVIGELCAATGCALPPETVEIRESFLQAARFVGREGEMARLSGALDGALEGRGSAWLVGGESGVGKSRLLDEFRTLALVRGVTVARGQAVREGRSPYHLWRDVLRRLALSADLCQRQVGGRSAAEEAVRVLELLVPDIANLVGVERGVQRADAPEPQASRGRLFEVVGELFRRQVRPVAVLLEDLQWAGTESMALLQRLVPEASEFSTLLIGTYRDDERPHLVDELPGMQALKLERLDERSIAELSASMLGPAGRRAPVVSLLQRETAGNPFFLVEVMRALAEEAGQLEQVGRMTLPASVYAAGVRRLVERRLNRVPGAARPLLDVAAVVGQALDLPLLRALDRDVDLEGWLTACGDVAVLEAREGQWCFAHDKLREGALAALDERERARLHRRVAEAIEATYGDASEQVARLAHHWEQAGDAEQAAVYLSRAGDQARLAYAHREAIDYYERAFSCLQALGKQERAARTLMKLGLTHHAAFDFKRAQEVYQEGLALWRQAGQRQAAAMRHKDVALPPAPHALHLCWDELSTLDPALANDADANAILEHLFVGLVTLSPETEVLPQAALDWEVSEGGRRYVFHLCDDLRWTDGRPLTAGDFEYAWKRVLDPATASPSAELLYDIQGARAYHQGQTPDAERVGVRALDRRTLAVRLEAPVAYFLYLLAHGLTCAVPRHVVERHGTAWTEPGCMVTSGPFTLERWERGSSGCSPSALVLVRDPDYRGSAGGNVERVELRLLTDRPSWLPLYEAGKADVVDIADLPLATMDDARLRHPEEYLSMPQQSTAYLGFVVSRPPLDDRRVRQALALAMDRETLMHEVTRGVHSVATGGFVPPGMPGHQAGIALPYDPERARRLLAEAGYPGGRGFPTVERLTIHAALPYSEPMRRQWQEALGVDIPCETVDWATLFRRIDSRPPHLYGMGWVADYPDPDSFLRASAFRHHSRWHHEVYDRLVEKARRVPDWEARLALYGQAERILAEEVPILPLNYQRHSFLIKPWVTRYPVSADGRHFWEEVILEPH
jgi:ABC-type oligopeptide transport system substrate-binding subunit